MTLDDQTKGNGDLLDSANSNLPDQDINPEKFQPYEMLFAAAVGIALLGTAIATHSCQKTDLFGRIYFP